ncbi:AAA family ATPase [Neptunomonas sp.]|uniref:McrB family protein n=1 Tax=Neptunomonas sp. TaxID=1971898 RepID=UPI0035644E78
MNQAPSIEEVISNLEKMKSKLTIEVKPTHRVVNFSNEGGRGAKSYFTLTLGSILTSYKNILDNAKEFEAYTAWTNDTEWRARFRGKLTDPQAITMAGTQTKPFLILLAKLISAVNETPYNEGQVSWNQEHIQSVIGLLESYVPQEENVDTTDSIRQTGGKNLLIYGAPGTGKSHRINKELLQGIQDKDITKTVFHSETQNTDFIGCLKPSMNAGALEYSFQPGPFSVALKKAIENPKNMHFLVIEEINRAAAAAVFGEVFQLLDREADGHSTYKIQATDPMQTKWLENELGEKFSGDITIPSNLSLYATMNSSDQGVMPMDTAFKRRWAFEYIAINFSGPADGADKCASGKLKIRTGVKGFSISWKDFALAVNKVLADTHIPEDRHLGPWFVTAEELTDQKSVLTGKLFMYLWDDVLRHGKRHELFSGSITTYGALINAYNKGQKVFTERLTEELSNTTSAVTYSSSKEEPAQSSNGNEARMALVAETSAEYITPQSLES